MKLFLILSTILINLTESSIRDVNSIIEILEKNSFNNTLSNLKLNKIYQKNLLSLNELSGNLSIEDKNILLEKLFLRDQKMEKLLETFSPPTPIVKKFSSHNSSKTFSSASTFPHQTLFIKDGYVERRQNDSNIKAIMNNSNIKSVFENQNFNNDLIAKYKIPPLLIRANLDEELKFQKQVLKTPRLLARIRSRTEDFDNKEKKGFQIINNDNFKIKENLFNTKGVTKILENNKKVAASELTDIMDKFKVSEKQKMNKNIKKQFFHAPPETILKKSTKKFYNQIYNTNDKSTIFNIRNMNFKNNNVVNGILKDKSSELDNFETLGSYVTNSIDVLTQQLNENNVSDTEVENIELSTLSNTNLLTNNEVNSLSSQSNILLNNITSNTSSIKLNASNILSNEATEYPSLNISDISNALNNLTNVLISDKTTIPTTLLNTTNIPEVGNVTLPSIGTTILPSNNETIIMESTTLMLVEPNSNISITTVASILNDNITATSTVTSIPNTISTLNPSSSGTLNVTVFPSTETISNATTTLSSILESSTTISPTISINNDETQMTTVSSLSTLEGILSTSSNPMLTTEITNLTTIQSNLSSTEIIPTTSMMIENLTTTPQESLLNESSTTILPPIPTILLPVELNTTMVSPMETTSLPIESTTTMISPMVTTSLPTISSTEAQSSSTPISISSTETPQQILSSTSSIRTASPTVTLLSSMPQSSLITTATITPSTDATQKCLDSVVECETYLPLCNHTTIGTIIKTNCPLTCGTCTIPPTVTCYDRFKLCSFSKFFGYCTSLIYTQEHKMKYCKETCGLC